MLSLIVQDIDIPDRTLTRQEVSEGVMLKTNLIKYEKLYKDCKQNQVSVYYTDYTKTDITIDEEGIGFGLDIVYARYLTSYQDYTEWLMAIKNNY